MKKYSIELKWGIIFTAIALLWMQFEKQMGWHDELIANHATYTKYFAVLAVMVYMQALLDKRKNYYGGFISWKQGFVSGLIVSAVVALLSPLSQHITYTYITPDYFENAMRYSIESVTLTREEAEDAFNMQTYVIKSFFFAFFVGAVTSAIVSIFVSRKVPDNNS